MSNNEQMQAVTTVMAVTAETGSTAEGGIFTWMHLVDQGKPIYSIYYMLT